MRYAYSFLSHQPMNKKATAAAVNKTILRAPSMSLGALLLMKLTSANGLPLSWIGITDCDGAWIARVDDVVETPAVTVVVPALVAVVDSSSVVVVSSSVVVVEVSDGGITVEVVS